LLLLVVLAVPPLRHRVTEKARAMAAGNAGSLLTYRTDAWRAAFWMLEQHPLAGVGHGAYRSTYASARLALARQGVDYSGAYRQISFFNAHNDALEVGAELGWPGLLALGFAIWTLAQAMRAAPGPRRALTFAGAASLALLALAGFPFETALVAYPWLLFLSGPLAPRRPAEEGAEPVPEPVAKPKPAGGRGPRRRR
jgi:O-antigen ligase